MILSEKPVSPFRDHALGSSEPRGSIPVRSGIALAVVVIALSGSVTAHAETEEGRQACMNDAFQFCGDAIPDRERVFRCLEARKHQISAACRANLPAAAA